MLARRTVLPTVLCVAAVARGQDPSIVETLADHTYEIAFEDGEPSGAGMDFLVAAASDAQFVLFAEEHNVREIPQLVAALFERLHVAHGFEHLAIESDPVSAAVASTDLRGDLEAIGRYARRFPYAFTFATDQELAMIARVGRVSTTTAHPVWGFDQVYGAAHVLDFVSTRAGVPAAPLRAVHDAAWPHESSRDSAQHFMSAGAKGAEFHALAELSPPDADAAAALEQLLLSDRIYRPYYDAEMPERRRAFYRSGLEREQNMKHLFLREYRRAAATRKAPPRAVVKAGHWHIAYGRFPQSQLLTLGNFLTEFATANGLGTLSISVHVHTGEEAGWRGVKGKGLFANFDDLVGEDSALIDLRPLRHRWATPEIEAAGLQGALFASDLVLLLTGAGKATYSIVRGG